MNERPSHIEGHYKMGVIRSGKQTQDAAPAEDLERIRRFVAKSAWKFARTMARYPHWYTLRANCDDAEFLWFVIYIREHGYDRAWGRKATYIYYDVDEYSYWTMGDFLSNTILINRAKVKETFGEREGQGLLRSLFSLFLTCFAVRTA